MIDNYRNNGPKQKQNVTLNTRCVKAFFGGMDRCNIRRINNVLSFEGKSFVVITKKKTQTETNLVSRFVKQYKCVKTFIKS